MHRDLGSFDGGARNAVPVSEITNLPGNRAPASAHARLRYARRLTIRSFFVNHEIERHEAPEQLREFCLNMLARENHLVGKQQVYGAIYTRHTERGVFNRLHENTATLCPLLDSIVEQLSR